MGNSSSLSKANDCPVDQTFTVKIHANKSAKRNVLLDETRFEGDHFDKLGSLKISTLSPYSILCTEGGLREGDHIVGINTYKVRQQLKRDALKYLEACLISADKTYLSVYRPAPAINENSYVDSFGLTAAKSPVKSLTFVISKDKNQGLGIVVHFKIDKVGLYIREVTKNGCAGRNGRLIVGDELVQINGVDLTWQCTDCVESLVKKTDLVQVTVRRSVKDIGTDASLSMEAPNGECFAAPPLRNAKEQLRAQLKVDAKSKKGIKVGGLPNQLSEVGQLALQRMTAGDFRKEVTPFTLLDDSFSRMGVDDKSLHLNRGKHINYVDFEQTRAECLKKKKLFEDPQFQANESSLYFGRRNDCRVTWLRPHQICKKPQLIVDGNSRFDVRQGELGDCWLIAAVANLAQHTELFHRVVPPNQSFTDKYAGIFHFQFWRYGRWVDVVVDDRLPVKAGTNELVYMRSATPNEFWSPLLEKAYAKLNGSYEALEGGFSADALEDMTGGLAEKIPVLKQTKRSLIKQMYSSFQMGSLMGCSMIPNEIAGTLPNGLITGHAYSITAVRNIGSPNSPLWLLRIRNPWGHGQQWNGDWSDNSKQWRSLSLDVKDEYHLTLSHDGEFWMCFEDFVLNFTHVEVCHLGPDVMNEVFEMTGVQKRPRSTPTIWTSAILHSNWRVAESTAGGHLTSHSSLSRFFKTSRNCVKSDMLYLYPRENDCKPKRF